MRQAFEAVVVGFRGFSETKEGDALESLSYYQERYSFRLYVRPGFGDHAIVPLSTEDAMPIQKFAPMVKEFPHL